MASLKVGHCAVFLRPRADQIEMKVTAASVFKVRGRNGKLLCLVFALRFIYFCFYLMLV